MERVQIFRLAAIAGLAFFSATANAKVIAQTTPFGEDAVFIYDDVCPGDSTARVRLAIRRDDGTLKEGCWVKNPRGNYVVQWLDERTTEEFASGELIKPVAASNPPAPPKPIAPVADAVFLAGAGKAMKVLLADGQIGLKQTIRECYANLTYESSPAAVASCFATDMSSSNIDSGVSAATGAPADPELSAGKSFMRAANGLRAIGVSSELQVRATLKMWNGKVNTAFRQASARSTLEFQRDLAPKP